MEKDNSYYLEILQKECKKGNVCLFIDGKLHRATSMQVDISGQSIMQKEGISEESDVIIHYEKTDLFFKIPLKHIREIYDSNELLYDMRNEVQNCYATFGKVDLPKVEKREEVYISGKGERKGSDVFNVNEIAGYDTEWGGWYDNGKFTSYKVRIAEKEEYENYIGFESMQSEGLRADYGFSRYIAMTKARMN